MPKWYSTVDGCLLASSAEAEMASNFRRTASRTEPGRTGIGRSLSATNWRLAASGVGWWDAFRPGRGLSGQRH